MGSITEEVFVNGRIYLIDTSKDLRIGSLVVDLRDEKYKEDINLVVCEVVDFKSWDTLSSGSSTSKPTIKCVNLQDHKTKVLMYGDYLPLREIVNDPCPCCGRKLLYIEVRTEDDPFTYRCGMCDLNAIEIRGERVELIWYHEGNEVDPVTMKILDNPDYIDDEPMGSELLTGGDDDDSDLPERD